MKTMATLALMSAFAQHPATAGVVDANSVASANQALSTSKIVHTNLVRIKKGINLRRVKEACSQILVASVQGQAALDRLSIDARQLRKTIENIVNEARSKDIGIELGDSNAEENRSTLVSILEKKVREIDGSQAVLLNLISEYDRSFLGKRKDITKNQSILRRATPTSDVQESINRATLMIAYDTFLKTIDDSKMDFSSALREQENLSITIKAALAILQEGLPAPAISSKSEMEDFLSDIWA